MGNEVGYWLCFDCIHRNSANTCTTIESLNWLFFYLRKFHKTFTEIYQNVIDTVSKFDIM